MGMENTDIRRKLYLITDSFPYGKGEKSFILPELNIIKESYDITIITSATDEAYSQKEWETKLDDDIKVVRISADGIRASEYMKWLIMFWRSLECWKEVKEIVSSHKMILR